MPAHRKLSGETDDAFFAALARGDTVGRACQVTGCSRQALYRRRLKYLAFDRRWREAVSAAQTRKREQRPRRRTGVTLPVFAACGRRGHKKALSDSMLLARLKAVRPHYRDS
jgi:hypothetical protein